MNGSQCLEKETKCGNGSVLMSNQSRTMPTLELKVYIRVVAVVFALSSVTAFALASLRLLNWNLFYLEHLDGGVHYFITGLMLCNSAIGFINSCVVINRSAARNTGRNITTWLLLESLFEATRVVYVFVCEVVIKSRGPLHIYELLISVVQYLLNSFLYCQMILRH
ncbi:jg11028 [Pararge aegeria aegeria]|uniref:Jg11028 protein n=1 Tax=Pararge aegeria aegeria TaxID=348720 RepID=A0A8S4S7H0_9NEOP|nr:jg11028 [Pararge aegeria aegeria]